MFDLSCYVYLSTYSSLPIVLINLYSVLPSLSIILRFVHFTSPCFSELSDYCAYMYVCLRLNWEYYYINTYPFIHTYIYIYMYIRWGPCKSLIVRTLMEERNHRPTLPCLKLPCMILYFLTVPYLTLLRLKSLLNHCSIVDHHPLTPSKMH